MRLAGATIALLSAAAAAAAGPGWLDVPFVRQQKNGCGPAVAAMILEYWGVRDARPGDGLRPGPDGVLASVLQRYFTGQGFHAFAIEGGWADIEEHLGNGRPLIVALRETRAAPLHYVVVAGIDETNVYLNDPARHKLTRLDRGAFASAWKAGGNWTLVAVPRRQ